MSNFKKKCIISLISDAGTPIISDPGQILVNECVKNEIPIFPIPGPSAVSTALSLSGFSDKYIFYGFLPNSEKEIEKELKNLSKLSYSIIFFVSAKKINKIIEYFKIFFSDRDIFIAREMTKFYEEYIRNSVSSLELFKKTPKGELTVVISDRVDKKNTLNQLTESVKKEIKDMQKRYSNKDVVSFISKKENISKKIIYNFCLEKK